MFSMRASRTVNIIRRVSCAASLRSISSKTLSVGFANNSSLVTLRAPSPWSIDSASFCAEASPQTEGEEASESLDGSSNSAETPTGEGEDIDQKRRRFLDRRTREDIMKLVENGSAEQIMGQIKDNIALGFSIPHNLTLNIIGRCGRLGKMEIADEIVSKLPEIVSDFPVSLANQKMVTTYLLNKNEEKAKEYLEKADGEPMQDHRIRAAYFTYFGLLPADEGEPLYRQFMADHLPADDARAKIMGARAYFAGLLKSGQTDAAKAFYEQYKENAPEGMRPWGLSSQLNQFLSSDRLETAQNLKKVMFSMGWKEVVTTKGSHEHVLHLLQKASGINMAMAYTINAQKLGGHVPLRPFVDFAMFHLRHNHMPAVTYLTIELDRIGMSASSWRHFFNSMFRSCTADDSALIPQIWSQMKRRTVPDAKTKLILYQLKLQFDYTREENCPFELLTFVGI